MRTTMLTTLFAVLLLSVGASDAFAHGGQYRGPGGAVPPSLREPNDPTPPNPPPVTGGPFTEPTTDGPPRPDAPPTPNTGGNPQQPTTGAPEGNKPRPTGRATIALEGPSLVLRNDHTRQLGVLVRVQQGWAAAAQARHLQVRRHEGPPVRRHDAHERGRPQRPASRHACAGAQPGAAGPPLGDEREEQRTPSRLPTSPWQRSAATRCMSSACRRASRART